VSLRHSREVRLYAFLESLDLGWRSGPTTPRASRDPLRPESPPSAGPRPLPNSYAPTTKFGSAPSEAARPRRGGAGDPTSTGPSLHCQSKPGGDLRGCHSWGDVGAGTTLWVVRRRGANRLWRSSITCPGSRDGVWQRLSDRVRFLNGGCDEWCILPQRHQIGIPDVSIPLIPAPSRKPGSKASQLQPLDRYLCPVPEPLWHDAIYGNPEASPNFAHSTSSTSTRPTLFCSKLNRRSVVAWNCVSTEASTSGARVVTTS